MGVTSIEKSDEVLLGSEISDWTDAAFYVELINKYGQPLLNAGCGTDRLLLD
jgi:hypothetical protein